MTNREILEVICDMANVLQIIPRSKQGQAIEELIDKLQNPTVQPVPCEDCISRQAVLDGIDKYIEKSQSTGTIDDFNSFAELVVKTLPPVENKGEWIDDGFYADGHSQHAYRCSECNEHYIGYVGEFKYCPNCGADMRPEPYKAER